ncbi:MAG: hypothetical protein QOG64_163, partial [Acidimicrobiaceae bacterium]|nr:hypothetical protein [Acidimicrobiaceae bacterium]
MPADEGPTRTDPPASDQDRFENAEEAYFEGDIVG